MNRVSTTSSADWLPLPGDGVGFVRTGWQEKSSRTGLATIQNFLEARGEALSKPGLGGRYRARLQVDGQTVYLKRFTGDKFLDRVRRWREDGHWYSPAEREMHAAELLRVAKIPATQALAWGKSRAGGVEKSFVILSAAAGEPADGFLRKPEGAKFVRALTQSLAELARRFHEAGYRHRDFYLCHHFVNARDDGGCEVTLIDLQRVFRPGWRAERWRVKDLAQLNYSALEVNIPLRTRLRFMRIYLSGKKFSATDRRLLRQIQKKTAAMARRRPITR